MKYATFDQFIVIHNVYVIIVLDKSKSKIYDAKAIVIQKNDHIRTVLSFLQSRQGSLVLITSTGRHHLTSEITANDLFSFAIAILL